MLANALLLCRFEDVNPSWVAKSDSWAAVRDAFSDNRNSSISLGFINAICPSISFGIFLFG